MSDSNEMTIYEFPLNNRARNFLRYENLIHRLELLIECNSSICAIQVLHELIELIRYNDIKSELLQNLQWQEQRLKIFSTNRSVNLHETEKLILEKQKLIEELDGFTFPITDYLNNNFLNATLLRFSVPGGTCNFDLPILNAWLHCTEQKIHQDLCDWYKPFDLFNKSIDNTLSLTRMSDEFIPRQANGGYYIQNFPVVEHPYTMIRIGLKNLGLLYPEVSAGKQHLTIHFFIGKKLENRCQQLQDNLNFELACCGL